MNEDKIEKMTLKILKEILNRYPVESNHSNYSNPLYQKAWDIVQRAVKKAKDLQVDVVITILDSSARVIMTYRMEHALLVSDEMAYKKAYGIKRFKTINSTGAMVISIGNDVGQ